MTRLKERLTKEKMGINGALPSAKPSPRATSCCGLLIDAHVHFHPCYDPAEFLHHAARHFDRARKTLNLLPHTAPGCLLLAENPLEEFFMALLERGEVRKRGAHRGEPEWRVEPTDEPYSLICRRGAGGNGDGASIIVIAGRQIPVREGLEVLALCTDRRFPVGRSLKSTLESVIRCGAVPVLPWGFGKWRLHRGSLVRKVLESGFSTSVYLGDNGNRLHLSREPKQFRLAAERGVRILPGSDPLPMRRHARNVGRYGFFLNGDADLNRPGQWIKRALRDGNKVLHGFGRREQLLRFCISQLAMQVRRR